MPVFAVSPEMSMAIGVRNVKQISLAVEAELMGLGDEIRETGSKGAGCEVAEAKGMPALGDDCERSGH